MAQATCSRCGRRTHVEYGADGLPYCSSCIFYGLNRQCWKCRMYLPASELQQYKGFWTCPICLQDMRYADKKAREYKPAKEPLRILSYSETCERCGRDLTTVHILNGRKLCGSCVEAEKEKWGVVGGGPTGASQRVSIIPVTAAKRRSLIEHLFSEFLALFGIRRERKIKVVEHIIAAPKMPIKYARPMSEDRMKKKKKKDIKKGLKEGLMKEEAEIVPVKKTKAVPVKKRKKRKAVPKKKKKKK